MALIQAHQGETTSTLGIFNPPPSANSATKRLLESELHVTRPPPWADPPNHQPTLGYSHWRQKTSDEGIASHLPPPGFFEFAAPKLRSAPASIPTYTSAGTAPILTSEMLQPEDVEAKPVTALNSQYLELPLRSKGNWQTHQGQGWSMTGTPIPSNLRIMPEQTKKWRDLHEEIVSVEDISRHLRQELAACL